MERDDRLFAVIGSCVAIGATAVVWLATSGPVRIPHGVVESSQPVVAATPAEVMAEPTAVDRPEIMPAVHRPDVVDDRDGLVRAATRRMTGHPEVLRWLVTDDLSNRIVDIVDTVAEGGLPRSAASVVATDRPFLVRVHDDGFAVAAGTSRRFDVLVAGLTSIDPSDAASLLREVEPELEAAWTERGGPGWFSERLRIAVDHMLEVRVPTGPLEVERRARYYEWADDDLRMASPVQKALLRMGGDNARAIQGWLHALRVAMGWPSPVDPLPVRLAEAMTGDDGGPTIATEGSAEDDMAAVGTR